MKAFLQYFIILLTLVTVSWIAIPAHYDISYPREIKPQFDKYVRKIFLEAVEEQQPDMVLLGDSMLYPAVDQTVLSEQIDQKILSIGLPGSASTLWYLIAKNNILDAKTPPKYLVIFFRDTMMTVPGYRVTGRYFEQIDEFASPRDEELIKRAYLNQMNPLEKMAERYFPPYGSRWSIRQGLDSRLRYTLPQIQLGCDKPCMDNAMEVVFGSLNMDLNFLSDALAAADDYLYSRSALNFDQQIGESFLPELIALTKEHNVQLVLVQMRILRFATPGSEPPALRDYNQGLSEYLAANGVIYLDYSKDQRLVRQHFDDIVHLNKDGQVVFTDMLAEDLLQYLQK